MFKAICKVGAVADGMNYDADTIATAEIRESDRYGGLRVTLVGHLGTARLRIQIDVGIGDAVTPEPEWTPLPTLLEQPAPRLRAYHPETAIAEKLQIIVAFGMANTRMKDFFDIAALAQGQLFEGARLVRQVRATFERRGTPIPPEVPVALTDEFSLDRSKQAQWNAFIARSQLTETRSLHEVMAAIRALALPVFRAALSDEGAIGVWPAGGPWKRS